MNITPKAKEYHEKMFPGYVSKFIEWLEERVAAYKTQTETAASTDITE